MANRVGMRSLDASIRQHNQQNNLDELRDRIAVMRNIEFSELLAPDAWAEAPRVWIVGGGPSLRGFNWDALRGEIVIGVNRAFEQPNVGMVVSMDARFRRWVVNGELGETTKRLWFGFQGPKVFTVIKNSALAYHKDESYYVVERLENESVDRPTIKLLGTGDNSGWMALQLAWALGAKEINLLGFDMHGANGKQAWYHNGYPSIGPGDRYEKMHPFFERAVPNLRRDGVTVTNYCPDSGLTCFPRASTQEAFQHLDQTPQRPLVIGYHTPDTDYKGEARLMVQSAKAMGLETDVREISDKGDWQRNTLYKALFIREMLRQYPDRALLYVDADARFRRYPALFDGCFMGNFACHYLKGHELLSGTLYFGPGAKARELADMWVEECKAHPNLWDQRNLASAVKRWNGVLMKLPAPYCRIFDQRHQGTAPPVIEHYQASRRHR